MKFEAKGLHKLRELHCLRETPVSLNMSSLAPGMPPMQLGAVHKVIPQDA